MYWVRSGSGPVLGWGGPYGVSVDRSAVVVTINAPEAPTALAEPRPFEEILTGPGRELRGDFGLVLSGADHLERHRWTMEGLYQFEGHLGSGSLAFTVVIGRVLGNYEATDERPEGAR